MVLDTIQLWFNSHSTTVWLLINGQWGHSDVTLAADPLAAVTLTYLFI